MHKQNLVKEGVLLRAHSGPGPCGRCPAKNLARLDQIAHKNKPCVNVI